MTDRLEKIGRMLDGTGSPAEYDPAILQAEIERLERPHDLGGTVADHVPGGPERLAAIKRRLKHGPIQRSPESNYARLAREAIEREDEAELDMQPPSDDLQAALSAREKALKAMDRALDELASARAAEVAAVDVILTHAPGKETREFVHLGHAAERIMARLGDIGIARDVRWDKSTPSPRLAELADCHAHIRKPKPVIRKQTKERAA